MGINIHTFCLVETRKKPEETHHFGDMKHASGRPNKETMWTIAMMVVTMKSSCRKCSIFKGRREEGAPF